MPQSLRGTCGSMMKTEENTETVYLGEQFLLLILRWEGAFLENQCAVEHTPEAQLASTNLLCQPSVSKHAIKGICEGFGGGEARIWICAGILTLITGPCNNPVRLVEFSWCKRFAEAVGRWKGAWEGGLMGKQAREWVEPGPALGPHPNPHPCPSQP